MAAQYRVGDYVEGADLIIAAVYPFRGRGYKAVLATADGDRAYIGVPPCSCPVPGEPVAARDLVTETDYVLCGRCRRERRAP